MKKILIFIVTCLSVFTYAQNNLLIDEINFLLNSKPRAITDTDIEGSVYLDKEYRMAKISGVEGIWPIRYDAFRDEIEVKKDKEIFALKKETTFNEINFVDKDERIVYAEYELDNKKLTGYLFEVLKTPATKLYKKHTIIFKKAKEATTTLEISTPNRFLTQDPIYYLKDDSLPYFIQLDKKAKNLMSVKPEQKSEITNCLKKSNLNLSNELTVKSFVNCMYR